MKTVMVLIWGGVGAIAVCHPAVAQTVSSSLGVAPLTPSSLLTTQPLEIEHLHTGQPAGLDPTTLNTVANSIQANPSRQGTERRVPDSPFPTDLFHTPSKILSDTHPLETFQPPAPNPSFGINLNRL